MADPLIKGLIRAKHDKCFANLSGHARFEWKYYGKRQSRELPFGYLKIFKSGGLDKPRASTSASLKQTQKHLIFGLVSSLICFTEWIILI